MAEKRSHTRLTRRDYEVSPAREGPDQGGPVDLDVERPAVTVRVDPHYTDSPFHGRVFRVRPEHWDRYRERLRQMKDMGQTGLDAMIRALEEAVENNGAAERPGSAQAPAADQEPSPADGVEKDAGSGLLSLFQQGQAAQQPPEASAAPALPAQREPEVRALIELPSFGQIEVWYHSIVRSAGTLVLIVDTKYRGTQFLPTDQERSFVVAVPRHGRAYLVQATGILYEFAGYRHCCLIILEERAWKSEESSTRP